MLARYTKKKLKASLRAVRSIKELDFPYPDSVDALAHIEREFLDLLQDIGQIGPKSDPFVVKSVCERSLEAIQNYLPILGFIVRSSDLDGPVELQGPLLRLTHDAIGKDAKLIISSEWEFSPFTILFPELSTRDFVLVGMPWSEANNALIAPLAGHELGHNIWNKSQYQNLFDQAVRTAIIQEMRKDLNKWSKVIGPIKAEQLEDLVGEELWSLSWSWAISQCEEIFCDYVGLMIFRESYLYAFGYLLAPGLRSQRNYRYPKLKDRVKMLIFAAEKAGIYLLPGYLEMFDDCEQSPVPGSDHHELGDLSDLVCSQLKNLLFETVEKYITEKDLCKHDNEEVERIYQTFKYAVPATKARCLSDIVSAGWRLTFEDRGISGSVHPDVEESDMESILNELILKSFEVFEIEQRQKSHDS